VIVPIALITGLFVLIGVLLALLVSTSWGTSAVAAVAQQILPPLHIEQAEGALLGQGHIKQLSWSISPTQTLVLDEIDWHLHHITLFPWPTLNFDHVHAQRLMLRGQAASTQASSSPITPPNSLVLPIGLHIDNAALDTLSLPALEDQPLRQLKAQIDLAAGPVGAHRINHVQGTWAHLHWQGQGQIGPTAPFQLKAQADIATTHTAPIAWQAQAQATGTLDTIALRVDLHGLTQTLQGTADIQPFATWPLPRLNLHTDQLNLAALHPSAPETLLSGDVKTQWQSGPMRWQVEADIHNAQPDSLDHHGLPIRHLRCRMSAQHANGITSGSIDSFVAELGREPPKTSVSQIEGHGQWVLDEHHQPKRLSGQLFTHITQLHPAEIDRRGPAFEITGPLAIETKLPWPISEARGLMKGASDVFMSVKTDLRGQQIDRSDLPTVQIQLNGNITPQRLRIEQLHAQAGTTHLQAQGLWEHQTIPTTLEHVTLEASLEHFDPRVWWPGENTPSWRNHPTLLDGTIKADLSQSTPALLDGLEHFDASNALMSTLQGEASVQLGDSLLVGLPLAGTLRIQTATTIADPSVQPAKLTALTEHPPLNIETAWRLGPKQSPTNISVRGTWHTDPSDDQWHIKVHSPALQLLQPWVSLAGSPANMAGDLEAEADLQGRWPEVYASGHLETQDLQMDLNSQDHRPGLHLQKLNTTFDAGSHPRDQLNIQASLDEASWPGLHLGATEFTVQGSANRHRLHLQSRVQLSDPTSGEISSLLPTQWLAQLTADGRWQHRPALHPEASGDSDHWEGQIHELSLRDAKAPASTPDQLRLDPTTLSYHREAQSQTLKIDPTRLQLLALHLVMDEFQLQTNARTATPRITLRSRLEPLDIAPLLARAQPGFGWDGDLKIGGHADLLMEPQHVSADIALERLAGDLQVNDPDNPIGPQPLGLADLRLALQGRQGHWQLSQQVAGGHLGTLEGQQSLRTGAQSLWPAKEDLIEGSIDLHIAELGRWGRWLPPGWRLSGKLDTQAHIKGQLGNPDLRGELHGSQIGIQNALNGIDWHDAELQATLIGNTARIETLRVQAGEGQIQADGEVVLNANNPHLHMSATARRFALLQRIDRHVVVSGTTHIDLDKQRTAIQGELRADEGRIDFSQGDAPSLSDDVVVVAPNSPSRERRRNSSDRTADSASSPSTASATNMRATVLDMKLDLGDAFTVSGRGLHTHLVGALALTNPGGKLAINGTIRTGEEGTYAAYGQKLSIDRGLIIFGGPPSNPQLDIEATRPDIDEVRVGVAVTGTVENMRVRLFSEPALNDTDKLSWLILGRAPDGLGRTDLALLQRAAYALLSGEGDSPSLLERVGLDQVSVRKSDGDTSETVVSLGKQLSRRWYVGYERSLNAASGTWQLIYRIAQRFTLRAQSGTDRAIDLIWIWRWRPPEPVIEPPPSPPAVTGTGPQGA
jgi:translocation and assembly module TamB